MIRVLFVCLGNICRSPMAEAIFRHKVAEAGLGEKIIVDSAGTGHWHIGERPHRGTQEILKQQMIDHEGITARQVNKEDMEIFQYIIAMDTKNLNDLIRLSSNKQKGEVKRLLDFVPEQDLVEVPDPYYSGNFAEVFYLIDVGCERLFAYIRKCEQI